MDEIIKTHYFKFMLMCFIYMQPRGENSSIIHGGAVLFINDQEGGLAAEEEEEERKKKKELCTSHAIV